MKTSKEWAYRVYWGKYARSEQFATRQMAKRFSSRYWKTTGIKARIKKERKTKQQKAEERIIKKSGVKKKWNKYKMELLLPHD